MTKTKKQLLFLFVHPQMWLDGMVLLKFSSFASLSHCKVWQSDTLDDEGRVPMHHNGSPCGLRSQLAFPTQHNKGSSSCHYHIGGLCVGHLIVVCECLLQLDAHLSHRETLGARKRRSNCRARVSHWNYLQISDISRKGPSNKWKEYYRGVARCLLASSPLLDTRYLSTCFGPNSSSQCHS